MQPPKLEPADLTQEELLWVVNHIIDAVYPDGNRDHAWTPDTIQRVADVLDQYHLRP